MEEVLFTSFIKEVALFFLALFFMFVELDCGYIAMLNFLGVRKLKYC